MMLRLSAAAALFGSLAAGTAHADKSATCARLRAEARAEAVVMYAPRLQLEGARAPRVVDAADPVATAGLQARASLALSVTDAMRGRAIERIAAADCARVHAADQAARVLGVGTKIGELAATRAEIAYREAHLGEVDRLVAEAMARFEAQRATAYEVDELRDRRAAMRVRIADLYHSLGLLEELDGGLAGTPPLARIAGDVIEAELAADHRRAELRSIAAWRVEVRGGVAAGDRPDWFATVHVGYSFGQPAQAAANRRALAARTRELATDERAAPGQLARLARTMRRSVADLEVQRRMLDEELATVRGERARVEAQKTDPARQLFARLSLEVIELEARRTAIETLAAARRPFAAEPR
ncbi:MAG: hypothetical protein KF773_16210 [Deltaproteobacteria bacterium]|nr:hypothetical protein [Deltaproteobacteria bacterium]